MTNHTKSHRPRSLLAASVLTLALAGCSGGTGPTLDPGNGADATPVPPSPGQSPDEGLEDPGPDPDVLDEDEGEESG